MGRIRPWEQQARSIAEAARQGLALLSEAEVGIENEPDQSAVRDRLKRASSLRIEAFGDLQSWLKVSEGHVEEKGTLAFVVFRAELPHLLFALLLFEMTLRLRLHTGLRWGEGNWVDDDAGKLVWQQPDPADTGEPTFSTAVETAKEQAAASLSYLRDTPALHFSRRFKPEWIDEARVTLDAMESLFRGKFAPVFNRVADRYNATLPDGDAFHISSGE